MDAAIAESSGKDFKFVNNLDYPIYIEGYTGGKQITFVIYGVETRDPGHKVKYESEVLSTTEPDSEKILPRELDLSVYSQHTLDIRHSCGRL